MDVSQAQRVIESLRKGIPPDGFVRRFTVGRETEIQELTERIDSFITGALLLKANYGSGKTHLLRFIREKALESGFAVSTIALDANAAVRFNRMDQIFGAILRNIELPQCYRKGPAALFVVLFNAMTSPQYFEELSYLDADRKAKLDELSTNGRWTYSKTLKSPALYIGLRAWIIATLHREEYPSIPQEVEGWLCEPWNYYTQRKRLYQTLVINFRRHFLDPRPELLFYHSGISTFIFSGSDYRQSWDALADLHLLAKLAGLKGLVLLVDEFEDVIYNLKKINFQQAAFWNLFRLFDGEFPGHSFYAVTPAFVNKCKNLLLSKHCLDYDFSRFDRLPTFEMSPLQTSELEELSMRILETHGIAYGWEPDLLMKYSQLMQIVKQASALQIQDRARHTIITVVKALDQLFENHNEHN